MTDFFLLKPKQHHKQTIILIAATLFFSKQWDYAFVNHCHKVRAFMRDPLLYTRAIPTLM